jgi:hypothetical protein
VRVLLEEGDDVGRAASSKKSSRPMVFPASTSIRTRGRANAEEVAAEAEADDPAC